MVYARLVRDRGGWGIFLWTAVGKGPLGKPDRSTKYNLLWMVHSGEYLHFEIEANEGGSSFSLIDRMGEANETKSWPDAPNHRTYQPGGPGTHWSGVAAGYHGFKDSLEDYITGGKVSSDYDEMCKK